MKTSLGIDPGPAARASDQWMGPCIDDGRLQGVAREIGILSKNGVDRIAVLDTAENRIDGHPSAADDGRPALDLLIHNDERVPRGTVLFRPHQCVADELP